MTVPEMLAVLEDEFRQAFVSEAAEFQREAQKKGPKRVPQALAMDRAAALTERFKGAGMKRPDIKPRHDNRPPRVHCGETVPTTDAQVVPSPNDQKQGAAVTIVAIPATVQAWNVEIPAACFDADEATFREKYARPAAESLATQGMDLGLTHYAALEVRDRPRKVTRPNDRTTNVRERALVVMAKGWEA